MNFNMSKNKISCHNYFCHKIKKVTKSVTFIFIYVLKKSDIKKIAGDKTTEKAVGFWLLNFFKSPKHRDTKSMCL